MGFETWTHQEAVSMATSHSYSSSSLFPSAAAFANKSLPGSVLPSRVSTLGRTGTCVPRGMGQLWEMAIIVAVGLCRC